MPRWLMNKKLTPMDTATADYVKNTIIIITSNLVNEVIKKYTNGFSEDIYENEVIKNMMIFHL